MKLTNREVALHSGGDSPLNGFETFEQIDCWGFIVTLYEMVSGTPLFENCYDRATPVAGARLRDWKGLNADSLQHIEDLHGKQESAALRDVLMWGLDAQVSRRPKTAAELASHAFFDPRGGSLRVHFLIDQIKTLLASTVEDRLDLNIMIR